MKTTIALSLTAAWLALAPIAHADSSTPPQPAFTKANPSAYGLQLARYMDQFNSGWTDQYIKARMTLYDARGDSVERTITQQVLEGASGDKVLLRFLGPAELRGVAALVHEHPRGTDDSWLYLPSSRRVRRISGANRTASFQGTEFTYEDLSSLIVDKYRWKHVEDGAVGSEPAYVLEATPTYRDSGYQRLLVHLNKRHWRVERIEYFDKAGRRLKTLDYGGWQHLHDRYWRARRMDMTNHQSKKRTVLDIQALFVDLSRYPKKDGSRRSNLTADAFSRRSLEAQ